jgi:hypothetical protein
MCIDFQIHNCESKKYWPRVQLCLERYVNPLVPAAFAGVSNHQPSLGLLGGLTLSLCVIHKQGLV